MNKWLVLGVEAVTTFAGVSSALWLNPACNINYTPLDSVSDQDGNMSCLASTGIGAAAGAAAGALIMLGLWGGHYLQRKYMNRYQPINADEENHVRTFSPNMQSKA